MFLDFVGVISDDVSHFIWLFDFKLVNRWCGTRRFNFMLWLAKPAFFCLLELALECLGQVVGLDLTSLLYISFVGL